MEWNPTQSRISHTDWLKKATDTIENVGWGKTQKGCTLGNLHPIVECLRCSPSSVPDSRFQLMSTAGGDR